MPLYTYECQECGASVEVLVSYVDRDNAMQHEGCGGALARSGLELPTLGKSAHRTQAVLGNGDHLVGHFGKDASRRKR